jgi:signal transduction histidine kinase/CHASE2 domain-containing sensor protein
MMSSLILNRFFSAILVTIIIALLLLLMWQGNMFQSAQLATTNIYFVPQKTSGNIIIVALDDVSLGRYGRSASNWSRQVYAELIDKLSTANIRVIAFDLLFSEATEDDESFTIAITRARQSENRTRIVLAEAGIQIPVSPGNDVTFPQALRYQNTLYPIASLNTLSNYTGFVNTVPDVDSLIRRQPSIIYHDDKLGLSFSIASYLAYLRIPTVAIPEVITSESNLLYVTPQRPIQVDNNGFWLQNFFGPASTHSNQTFQTVSLVDVIDGQVDMSIFNDRIALVGLVTIAGDADRYPVPSELTGGQMAGVEIQANAIETLISNAFLVEQPPIAQVFTIIGLTFITSILCVFPRWYWKLLIAIVIFFIGLITALTIFNTLSIITPLLFPTFAIALPTLAHIGLDTNREMQLRRRADFLLETVSELTEQHMELKTVLPHIAKDLQILLPGSSGAIYIQPKPNTVIECLYYWPDEVNLDPFDNIVESVKQEITPMYLDIHLGIPIWWQGNLLAIIVISHGLARRRLSVIQDFVNRLAPIINGTLLYEEINRQRSTLAAVLSNTPAVVLVLDQQHRVQLYSEQATKLLKNDSPKEKLLVTIFNSLGVSSEAQSNILSQMQETSIFHDEITLEDKTYDLQGALIHSLGQWILALNDVTDLVELSKLKTQMIRMASHDLKNPLGRITGYIQLINSLSIADEKLQKYLHPIERSADEMNQLIGDLLNLERTRSERHNMDRFSLREVVEQIASRHGPDALQKKQQYHVDLISNELNMLGDLRQISQVVSNLIGNAIKYTPEGGSIDIRLQANQQNIRFEVQDTGYGILKEAQEGLFTEFYRVRTKETAEIPGTGLGLSLVKSVIKAHNGQVGVESEENIGSTFYFTLPNQEGRLNA